jgi:hypothetical protein
MSAASPPVRPPARGEISLHGLGWDWLVELSRRLRVPVQLVDARSTPVLPAPPGAAGTVVGRALAQGAGPLRLALDAAVQTRLPETVILGGVQVQCYPILAGEAVGGALIVARPQTTSNLESARMALGWIGSALAGAVEAHVAGMVAEPRQDWEHLDAFMRLLREQPPSASEHQAVLLAAEALAVWYDWELRGYVEASEGDFVLDALLPGVDPRIAPRVIPAGLMPVDQDLWMLPGADHERLGLAPDVDVLLARLGRGRGSWLLVISGRIRRPRLARLRAFIGVLAEWRRARLEVARSRLVSAVARVLLAARRGAGEAVEATARRLEVELGGAAVQIAVTDRLGTVLAAAGEANERAGERIMVASTSGLYTATATVVRRDGRRVTEDYAVLAAAVCDLLALWYEGWTRGDSTHRLA